jgi:hypothetical protein
LLRLQSQVDRVVSQSARVSSRSARAVLPEWPLLRTLYLPRCRCRCSTLWKTSHACGGKEVSSGLQTCSTVPTFCSSFCSNILDVLLSLCRVVRKTRSIDEVAYAGEALIAKSYHARRCDQVSLLVKEADLDRNNLGAASKLNCMLPNRTCCVNTDTARDARLQLFTAERLDHECAHAKRRRLQAHVESQSEQLSFWFIRFGREA